ncbi:MAG: PT domain-containing protein [Clostridiales bacterium]|nr:PT domain-containing protein [Clostridiales bacterium]
MFTKLHGSAVFVKVLAIMTALLLCLAPMTSMAYADSITGKLSITINEVDGASDAVFKVAVTMKNASFSTRYTIKGDDTVYTLSEDKPINLKAGQTAVIDGVYGDYKIELQKIENDTATTTVKVNDDAAVDGSVLELAVENDKDYNVTFTRTYAAEPTAAPTAEPTVEPTAAPTVEPTAEPTVEPTAAPTEEPVVEYGTLTVKVEKAGEAASTGDKSFKYTITQNGKPVGDAITVESGKSTEVKLPVGAYTIEQATPSVGCTVTVKVGDGVTLTTDAADFEVKANADTTVKYTNTYTAGSNPDEDTKYDLKIKTVVKGDKADEDAKFVLTVKFDADGSYKMSNGKKIKSGDTVTLTGNDSITIYNLPEGTTYKVRQKTADEDYKTTYKNCSGELTEDTTARVTNTWADNDGIVKTGDDYNNQLVVMMMLISAAVALGAGVTLRRKFAK